MVVGPEANAFLGTRRLPVAGGKEGGNGGGVTGHDEPGGGKAALGAAGVAGEVVHDEGGEMGVGGEVGEDGLEVEVAGADVEGEDAVGGKFLEVEGEGFASDEVHGE